MAGLFLAAGEFRAVLCRRAEGGACFPHCVHLVLRRSPSTILVHFRPMHGMYHICGYSNWALVRLPTPAICFDEGLLAVGGSDRLQKGRRPEGRA